MNKGKKLNGNRVDHICSKIVKVVDQLDIHLTKLENLSDNEIVTLKKKFKLVGHEKRNN